MNSWAPIIRKIIAQAQAYGAPVRPYVLNRLSGTMAPDSEQFAAAVLCLDAVLLEKPGGLVRTAKR